MRTLALRALILAAALLALAVPAFHVTGTPGLGAIPTASACSNVGCVITTTMPIQIESFVSPITVSATTATFAELATSAETTAISLTGTLGFTVMDARGNDQGFVAAVTSSGFTSSLFPLLPIPASAISVAGTPTVTLTCYGPFDCGPGLGVASSVGATLDTAPAVAVECPIESIGEGQYVVSVPVVVSVSGMTAEKLGSYPASWLGTFSAVVTEGQPVASFTSYGCSSSALP